MINDHYADIILPLAVRGRFTYSIPDEMSGNIMPGMRVMVQFGNRNLYYGIVSKTHNEDPGYRNIKSIISVPDTLPLINDYQLNLWQWISEYYLCSEGEVMKAALPSAASISDYRPRLETFVSLSEKYSDRQLNEILDRLKKAPKQLDLLITYLRITGYTSRSEILPVNKTLLLTEARSSPGILDTLATKGILSSSSLPVSRISEADSFKEPVKKLSDAQDTALKSVTSQFREKEIEIGRAHV